MEREKGKNTLRKKIFGQGRRKKEEKEENILEKENIWSVEEGKEENILEK